MKRCVYLLGLVSLFCVSCGTTIDFQNLSNVTTPGAGPVVPGVQYPVGTIFLDNNTQTRIAVVPFRWPTTPAPPPVHSGWTNNGYVQIVAGANHAGGTGNEVLFNNANLAVLADPNRPTVSEVSFKFGDLGGNINLLVNGTVRADNDFNSIGAIGSVTVNAPPPQQGTAVLTGTMNDFPFTFPYPVPSAPSGPNMPAGLSYSAVVGGGQELSIDDLYFE